MNYKEAIDTTKKQIAYFESAHYHGDTFTPKEKEHISRLYRILAWYKEEELKKYKPKKEAQE